ncbi:fungal-specific transcription factor domain-containing protein [Plectosphaerella plurivora]|uniref:Fungal-specific transcription factor domain-containing protein n=1 Tax=Plectosphaerella plurivora TaxID=936078 RepID=A0A9P8VIM7_9PEZI|nr:fungal-specific transcription factor domain-containing protein [Plectosphaerella plurivora]
MDPGEGSRLTPTPPTMPARHNRSNVCTQCKRQKQKCDRQSPCANCVRRDIPHLCHVAAARESYSSRWRHANPADAADAAAAGATVLAAATPSTTRSASTAAAQAPNAVPPSTSRSRVRPIGSAQDSPMLGQLWNSRGAASYHGTSYFGHQSAAIMMQVESPDLPVGMSGIHAGNARRGPQHQAHRSEKGPYSHIWELVGYLPRRRTIVDHLLRRFMDELNPIYDSVHEETFMNNYEAFWNRRWGDDDLTSVDLRWLSLLFVVLAFAELLDCPQDASPDTQRDREETSVHYFWASRKAIVIAPTFSGESPDLVRAGILVSRYLLYVGRKSESWLTSSFAIRMAQAQGMHVDGQSWNLPPKVLETRRRLWCTLHALDRSISLAIGRPYTINDRHCMRMNIRNVWIDDKSADDVARAEEHERPLSDPTPSIFYHYVQNLATTMGEIHDECFGLTPLTTSYGTYEKVLGLDRVLFDWAEALPPYFQLENPDTTLDAARPYLFWQRMYLHSAYHFSRITLHRTYVLLESITDRFQYSRDACMSSACADLKLKLSMRSQGMADRLKSAIAMHNLFNSALVLGIIAVRDPFSPRAPAILDDLAAYCEKQRADRWVNEFALAEIKVIELCIASAKKSRRDGGSAGASRPPSRGAEASNQGQIQEQQQRQPQQPGIWASGATDAFAGNEGMPNAESLDSWLWFGPSSFPEPMDFQVWEDLVGTLEPR